MKTGGAVRGRSGGERNDNRGDFKLDVRETLGTVSDLVPDFPSSFERRAGVDIGGTQRCEQVHLPARRR